MEHIEIPEYVNRMPSFWWWELDEFIVMTLFIIVGYLFGGFYPLLGVVVGLVVANRVKKWKQGELDGVLQHILFDKGFIGLSKIYKNQTFCVLWV